MDQQAFRSIVRARGLKHVYGKTQALAPLDIDIPAGVMAGFIGPDGVGKSTLLSLITGVSQLQQGQLTVLGGDINNRRHRNASLPRLVIEKRQVMYHVLTGAGGIIHGSHPGRMFTGSGLQHGMIDHYVHV